MEINLDTMLTVLAVIGVILTFIFGFLGVRYALKSQKKTEVTFFKNACIPLFDAIVRNLNDIEINFRGKTINENLILFKGTFFNNGNVDIDKSIIHKPLEIELPANFSWVAYKLIDTSDDLEVDLSLVENRLSFGWELFKEGEYIAFDCLIEHRQDNEESNNGDYDISTELLSKIKFNHRITNLKRVNKKGSLHKPKSGWAEITFYAVFLFISFGGYYSALKPYVFPAYKLYHEVQMDSETYSVELKALNEFEVSFVSDDKESLKIVNIDGLNDYLVNKPVIKEIPIIHFKSIFTGALATGMLFIFGWMFLSDLKDRRIYKKLKNVVDSQDNLGRSDG